MKIIISFIYLILFIISEFQLKNVKFLSSFIYGFLLFICIVVFIIVDPTPDLNGKILCLILIYQTYSFICRIYLWNSENNLFRFIFHHNAGYGELNIPRIITLYDCSVFVILDLYIGASLTGLNILRDRFGY